MRGLETVEHPQLNWNCSSFLSVFKQPRHRDLLIRKFLENTKAANEHSGISAVSLYFRTLDSLYVIRGTQVTTTSLY